MISSLLQKENKVWAAMMRKMTELALPRHCFFEASASWQGQPQAAVKA